MSFAFARHAAAGACFVALALAFTAPALPVFATAALGHPGNDVWNHVWGYRWVADELSRGELPVHTDVLGWPRGGSLWFIDTFGAVLTLPVQAAWGPVAAYNAAFLLNFVLCGVGAYVLALQVTGSAPGALLAGFAFMSAPHLLAQAYNGIGETLAAGWLPLTLAAMRAARDRPTTGRAVLAGACWAVGTLANWYYGLFAGMVLLGALRRDTPWRALAVGVVTYCALAVGPFALFVRSMEAADALVTRDPGFVWNTLLLHNMTDAATLVRPGRFYSPDLKTTFGEDLIVVVYLGFALLVPAALSLLGGRASRPARPWAWMAAVFLLFTLGPFLYVGGDYVQVGGGWIPLPFLAAFEVLPMFGRIAHAYRFVVGATLALCVLAAWAVRLSGRRAVPVALVLAALRVGEAVFASPAVMPLPTAPLAPNPVYASLSGGAVLDLPVGVPVLARSQYVANQIAHGQPIPYGLNDPTPPYLYYNRFGRYLLELERSTTALLPPRLPTLDLALGRADLVASGLRWIVLHRAAYPPAQLTKVAGFLDLVATPVHADEELRVYRLDP